MNFGAMIAYIGPGGGFAVSASLLTVVIVVAGILLLVVGFPISTLWYLLRPRRVNYRHGFRKVVVLGLDGLEPKIVRRLMQQGRLPNFAALARNGHFSELRTVAPAITPAAWSSFMTGNDPSRHNIFDFITRDPATYLPRLSSSDVLPPRRILKVGRWRIPISRPRVRMLRKGVPFWHVLGRHRLEVTVLRMPITFPPERFRGRLLSGMCVPDLLGTQGTFSSYSTHPLPPDSDGGQSHEIRFEGASARCHITGPKNPYAADDSNLTLPLLLRKTRRDVLELKPGGTRLRLRVGEQSDWVALRFRAGPARIHGRVRFHLNSCEPRTSLYMTPVHIDPERPAMPLSHPEIFCSYLAKRTGVFGTLGLTEDTGALNDGALDAGGFLKQAWALYQERERMFLETLDKKADDLTICVFDTPDRLQHMFWRQHEQAPPDGQSVVDQMVTRMDRLVGETLKRLDDKTLLIVLSDHGFTSFRRGVNLNTWLRDNGYLYLKPDAPPGRPWLEGVDWQRTRAYALGLSGVFVNLRGREARGIVEPGAEFDRLLADLKAGLERLMDETTDGEETRVIRRVRITSQVYSGPYRFEGPDLLVGYEAGYRVSWESAKGQLAGSVLADNTRAWSGDHCVDPDIVPGVLFSNARFARTSPGITDLAPTILDVFGVAPEAPMQGESLLQRGRGTS